jgi:hypothetical protein
VAADHADRPIHDLRQLAPGVLRKRASGRRQSGNEANGEQRARFHRVKGFPLLAAQAANIPLPNRLGKGCPTVPLRVAADAQAQHFAIVRDGRTVATALPCLANGLAGVCCVATVPGERGKGPGARVPARGRFVVAATTLRDVARQESMPCVRTMGWSG